ncbi:MAG: class II aldolase/adducin family protein [Lachnospiraceae bacterium]
MKYQETREKVLEVAVKCLEKGLIHGTAGNVSMRVPGEDVVIITPTRIPYDQLTPEQLPAISLYAELLDGEFKPSSEAPMHTAIYRARTHLNGIVHTHSMFATVFSILEKEIPPMMPPSTPYAPVPVAPFELPGSEELGQAAVKALGEDKMVCTLQNHGLIAACPTLERAFSAAEYIEECAQLAYWSMMAGKMNPIPDEAVKELHDRMLKGIAV